MGSARSLLDVVQPDPWLGEVPDDVEVSPEG